MSDTVLEVKHEESNLDSNRKLATIQTIDELRHIEGADSIELAIVGGWRCVVKRGEFNVGDLGVYFEIDSILPDGPEWSEFMRPRGFRIKTIRLRGQVSQGLMLPLNILPEDFSLIGTKNTLVGLDVTDILNIGKYVPPVFNGGNSFKSGRPKGNFPGFLHKTDEPRVQNLKKALLAHSGKEFYWTEKYDGSSLTVYLNKINDGGNFGVCSRNLDLDKESGGIFWETAIKLDIESKLRNFGKNIALQGELLAPGVQGNKYNRKESEYHIFNVFDIDNDKYYDINDASAIVSALGLTFVHIGGKLTLNHSIDELVEMARGKSFLDLNVHREGIVLRPIKEEYCDIIQGRLSFKAINPDFLLKYDV